MPRRASSSASPLWIGIAVVGFAAVLGAGHFFQRGVADPFRTMTPLPVQDYLENSNSLRGNSYKLDGTIGSQIHAVDGVGRLYSVGLPGGEMLAVFVPPDFNQINIEFTRLAQGFHQADDTKWFVIRAREADLGGHDFTVQAVFTFFTLTAVTKFSSDGSILFYFCHKTMAIAARCAHK